MKLLSLLKSKAKSEIKPMETNVFVPNRKCTAVNEIVPRIHGAVKRYWESDGHFNVELYNRIVNIRNAE